MIDMTVIIGMGILALVTSYWVWRDASRRDDHMIDSYKRTRSWGDRTVDEVKKHYQDKKERKDQDVT